jgi:hypothetical protein
MIKSAELLLRVLEVLNPVVMDVETFLSQGWAQPHLWSRPRYGHRRRWLSHCRLRQALRAGLGVFLFWVSPSCFPLAGRTRSAAGRFCRNPVRQGPPTGSVQNVR